ncbi:MAG: universal stress protein [Candidatus Eisenbacteria bacterium]|nr:universal stress protein [Candidatus Eisenbacteria bacterium]
MEEHRMFDKILVAVDGSLDADAAVKAGATIARAEGATLDICHAFHIPDHYRSDLADAVEDELKEDARRTLEHAAGVARSAGIDTAEHLLEEGHPAAAVLGLAARLGSTLIVLGVRGKSPDTVRALGSVSAAVSQGAECSVLLVRRKPGEPG